MDTDVSHNPRKPLRVVLADDHASYRYALGVVLSAHRELEVVGEAADGRSALDLIARLSPDVAVIDLMMAPLDGFDVCRSLAERRDPVPTGVLLISAHEDPELVARGRSCGASGYISKERPNEALCRAVLAVGYGGTCFAEARPPRLGMARAQSGALELTCARTRRNGPRLRCR